MIISAPEPSQAVSIANSAASQGRRPLRGSGPTASLVKASTEKAELLEQSKLVNLFGMFLLHLSAEAHQTGQDGHARGSLSLSPIKRPSPGRRTPGNLPTRVTAPVTPMQASKLSWEEA